MATITFTYDGGVSATSFTATSSRKYKKDITPTKLPSALDLIETTQVVDFKYKDDKENTPHIGFIAEDTDPLLSTPSMDKMDYTNCIGVLLKAVQELTARVKELEKQKEDS